MIAAIQNYENVEVEKPWGYEYLMYGNRDAALWFLYLKPGASTSLHCHPRKKTGLVLLSGEAEISFLNDSTHLKALNRVIIRPGLFHSTKATSPEGIVLLEIETPRDKENLVRLEDTYGRKAQPYEGGDHVRPLPADRLVLQAPDEEQETLHTLAGCQLSVLRTNHLERIADRDDSHIFVILEGGLFSREGEPILSVGDVVNPRTWHRLASNFSIPNGIVLLTISRP